MKFSAKINIMPQDALLDPQGKTVENNTSKLDINNITNIRIGKHITFCVESNNKEDAIKTIENICEKLLVNQITEKYNYELSKED
ncbi:MAG: phosphoribosylformylglycinamidine synthase, purS protein [Flavobacteriales bacterium]|jgi:phosphoribosylformylglycinamidine synthase PurS subunit|nr:phosphoribosylformylglycinamidine synthase, purS protein [Flavobacteriales bacterium]|tara:strand:+ start:13861 stop:14115 length:255 start_codon:yes stop_codon:yes gene_type:complete